MPLLPIRRPRGVTMLAPVIFVLSACAAPFPTAAQASASFPAQVSAPATVQGFMSGYTDIGLTHLVSDCVAEVPVPEMTTSVPHTGWHVQVNVSSIYMPHATTVVKATLLAGDHEVASRWLQTAGLNTAPRAAFCDVVSDLIQQLWAAEEENRIA